MFKMIDTDNSGHITYEELKAGLEKFGANLKEPEIYALMQAVSFSSQLLLHSSDIPCDCHILPNEINSTAFFEPTC